MNKLSAISAACLLLLGGCAGTRLPKLAKCTGPYRYANPYGSVLPSLPIPGQPTLAPPTAPSNAPDGAAPAASSPVPAPAGSAADPSPSPPPSAASVGGKTSALAPYYPSC